MSQQQRKQNLYGVQDWQNIYQTFRDADFKSYDYETLRKSMVDFLRIYNPENFNDYINSSEYISLLDLIAFMGQSLSFRMDLNARESYLETARRRDSILRLSKLVNYAPKRNLAANGYLKIESVSTNETVTDTLGNVLTNVSISWNNRSNVNWQDQWNTVLNAAITSSQRVGKPGNSALIDGITTSEYTVDLPSSISAPFRYSSVVSGTTMDFEAYNPTVSNGELGELGSDANTIFNILYRDDQRGYSSNNTGFFIAFKQGTLLYENFTITESLPNRQVYPASTGVNNDDVWLFQIGSNLVLTPWTKLDAVSGVTVSYNTAASTNKKVFSVESRADDAITLNFGDGVFSEIPVGDFVTYYRVSNGLSYRITPAEMTNVTINIPYVSKTGRSQILTVVASLKYTVANSATRETLDDIKIKAPQNFYTQNRMVNGQDYNSFPYVKYNNIVKIKSVNRMSSGVSRYLDVVDETGRFSSTNIVCDDGYLYTEVTEKESSFTFNSPSDISENINTLVTPAIADTSMLAFFYENYETRVVGSPIYWNLVLSESDSSSGFITNSTDDLVTTEDDLFYAAGVNKFKVGAVLKFTPPSGQIFNYENRLVAAGVSPKLNQKTEIYATVKSLSYLGRGNQVSTSIGARGRDSNGVGAIILSEKIPTGAILSEIYPTFTPILPAEVQRTLAEKLGKSYNVGLVYTAGSSNPDSVGSWSVVLNPTVPSTFTEGSSTTGWLMSFVNVGSTYHVYQRSVRYFFGSERQTRFFYDPTVKIYDPASGKLLKDRITVLKSNTLPIQGTNLGFATDIVMGVYNRVVETNSYLDDSKIEATFADKDSNGSPDNPLFYKQIVGPDTAGDDNSYIFFVNDQDNSGSSMKVVNKGVIKLAASSNAIDTEIYTYVNNDVVFTLDTNVFYKITRTGDTASKAAATEYDFRQGRYDIKFQYQHNAPADRRIDPSPSNIIDIFVLEKAYADDYTAWIKDYTGVSSEPTAPSTESLRNSFAELENYRMISDLIIYSSAKFKPLFGKKAETNYKAKFVVVKNVNVVVSDSEVKSQVIGKINEYFSYDNWDFGETFYFSDLAGYLHSELNTIISSIHLVPTGTNQVYGDLQQIRCQPNEILTSAATVLDVEVVTNLTNAKLNVGRAI